MSAKAPFSIAIKQKNESVNRERQCICIHYIREEEEEEEEEEGAFDWSIYMMSNPL